MFTTEKCVQLYAVVCSYMAICSCVQLYAVVCSCMQLCAVFSMTRIGELANGKSRPI